MRLEIARSYLPRARNGFSAWETSDVCPSLDKHAVPDDRAFFPLRLVRFARTIGLIYGCFPGVLFIEGYRFAED